MACSLKESTVARLHRAWTRRGPLACALVPVSAIFGALTTLHRWIYRYGWKTAERLPVPVVVVGNVVAGGAGKTPTVMALVRHLQQSGKHPAVLSRGYGRHTHECLEVSADSLPHEVGDEPLLIHRSTSAPVFVARRRVDAGRAAIARHPGIDVLICDDGFQHLALHRDLEICVFDERGVGNGLLLPAGPLREPWPRAADLILHTGNSRAFHGFGSTRALADHGVVADGRQVDLPYGGTRPLLALAGIATPEKFFSMLRAKGLELQRTLPLPDHWDFAQWDASAYRAWQIICTEKDAIKLWHLVPDAIAVPLNFMPEPAFFETFDQLLAQRSISLSAGRS